MKLNNGTIILIGPNWVVTILPNGKKVFAVPKPGQEHIAQELGYEGNSTKLTLDHDPLHSRLCDMLDFPHSFSLMLAAGELPADQAHIARLEEAAVLAIQKFLNAAKKVN